MRNASRPLFLLLALTAFPGCGDDDDDSTGGDGDADADADGDGDADAGVECAAPEPPAGPGSLGIGLAGAPLALFGDEADPDYATAFADLAASGLDLFAPIFRTEEGGALTGHFDPFLAPACDGPSNPWAAAAGTLKIVFPAWTLVTDDEWHAPLVEGDLSARMTTLVDTCMAGDDSVLGGLVVYEAPARAATLLALDADPDDDLLVANVPAAARALRTVTQAPIVGLESAFTFELEHYPEWAETPDEDVTTMRDAFFDAVDASVGENDVYGFAIAPIEKPLGVPPLLEAVGEWVDQARSREPEARLLSVQQGFAEDDRGAREGRAPTATELRYMAFYALIHGAGMLWWDGASALEPDAPLWEDLLATAAEVRTVAPLLDLTRIDLPPQTSRVEARGFIDGDTVWILAANPTDGEQRLTVPLARPGGPPNVTLRDFTTGEVLGTASATPWSEQMAARAVRVMSLTACE